MAVTGDDDIPEPPEMLTGLSKGDRIRFDAADEPGYIIGEVDEVRTEPGKGTAAVTVMVGNHKPAVYDIESLYDPGDQQWQPVVAMRRQYSNTGTHFKDVGEVSTIHAVDLGVEPEELDPGRTARHADGTLYRVVEPPAEREFDNKMLGYALDAKGNTVEKVDTEKLMPETLRENTEEPHDDDR